MEYSKSVGYIETKKPFKCNRKQGRKHQKPFSLLSFPQKGVLAFFYSPDQHLDVADQ